MSNVVRVKEATDIVEIIGERVTLSRSGANFRGLCPFHSEKSPSFFVSPVLQRYRCFGCSETGDVYTFLEKFDGMSFAESLRMLADRAGIKLEEFVASPEDQLRDRLLELLALSKDFYHYLLTKHELGKPAREYLKNRGVSEQSIKIFRIGYAPDEWSSLTTYLNRKKKFTVDEIVKSGLAITKSGRTYDRFRGRIMFPLTNHRGQVVGFSGRVLDANAKEAKYINTPETLLYHKSQLLFGLSELYQEIRKEKSVLVVEGELDVISSAQAHVNNIVAIKGSAFTVDHAKLLRRTVDKVILCLDSDDAGQEATKRAIAVAEAAGIELRVIEMVGGKDPDDLARQNPANWREVVKKTVSAYQFLIDLALKKYANDTPEGKRHIINELASVLANIPHQVEKDFYIKKLAESLDVRFQLVAQDIEKFKDKGKLAQVVAKVSQAQLDAKKPKLKVSSRRQKVEKYSIFLLLKLLEQGGEVATKTKQFLRPFLDDATVKYETPLFQQIAILIATHPGDLKTIILGAPQDLQEVVAQLYLNPQELNVESDDIFEEWQRSVWTIEAMELEQKVVDLTSKLDKLAATNEAPDANEERQVLTQVMESKRALAKLQSKLVLTPTQAKNPH